jgi:hypothetical protein
MPIPPPVPTLAPPMGGGGIFEIQDASGVGLYAFNATGKPSNSNDFLKPAFKVESAGGSTVQWMTGDGLIAGGTLMFQERKVWANAAEEAADLAAAYNAAVNGAYLANAETGTRCAIFPGTPDCVVPLRTDRLYGLSELNFYVTPQDKAAARRVLRGGE